MSLSFRSWAWELIFSKRASGKFAWQPANQSGSLSMISQVDLSSSASILDLGGASSFLAEQLKEIGYSRITVADRGHGVLADLRERSGTSSAAIRFEEADPKFFSSCKKVDLWHDRKYFPQLQGREEMIHYAQFASYFVNRNGSMIVARKCEEKGGEENTLLEMAAAFAPDFELEESAYELHCPPSGKNEWYLLARFIRK